MAVYTTLTSAAEVINTAGDTAQIVIQFTRYESGSGAHSFSELGIRVADWGSVAWDYALDDGLIVPGEYAFSLFDRDGDFSGPTLCLFKLLFPATNLQYETLITLKINGTEEYVGRLVSDSIDYDLDERKVSMKVEAASIKLNEMQLFAADGTTPINTLGLTASTWYSLPWLIQQIYKLVDSSIALADSSLTVRQGWTYYGVVMPANTPVLSNLTFSELYQLDDPLFFQYGYGLKTMGDVLRKLAIDWGCFTGFLHKRKAFFHQLFYYDSGNTQTLPRILSRKCAYRFFPIDYVSMGVFAGGVTIVPYSAGTYNALDEKRFDRGTALVSSFYDERYTNIKAVRSATTYDVYRVGSADVNAGAQNDYGEHGVNWWLAHKGNLDACRVDSFVVAGVTMDFTKSFSDSNGNKYQIISMKKKIADSQTEIDALYLGT